MSLCVPVCDRPIEIPFGDRDQVGDYTLTVDDIVEFNIATDRRDKLQRATNIVLSEHTFFVSKEQREKVRVKVIVMLTVLFYIRLYSHISCSSLQICK